ncbi:hypothetical protein KPH14_002777 [Odynerus spinipes]|uniref:Ashwin n=1 Tax=Odynerus spinipes TaxID=1348599 RepID=A0AAD9RLZ8_9HYME|nr:hypothetical protein KPH14_002777 [Odynerus spinipes]
MSTLDLHRPTQPELLSEHELCQILKNSCIEIKNFEKLSKTELVEIYKRVALPLPQRQHGNKKYKEENKNNMDENSESEECDKNVTLQNSNSNESINISSTNSCEKRKRVSQVNATEISKLFIDETNSVSKKICLSTTSKIETECNGIMKHKITEKNEDSTLTPTKKRQKITWP